MSDYRSAFNAMAADIGAIIALLGFDRYPGVDPVLRAITDLVLAKAESEGLKAERDAAQARVAELEQSAGYLRQDRKRLTSQAVKHRDEIEALRANLAELEKQEPVATLTMTIEGTCKLIDFDGHKAAFSLPAGEHKLYAAPVAQAGQVPEGWRMVPVEPTEWPLEAGLKAYDKAAKAGCEQIDCMHDALYEMLAAAPAQGGE